MRVLLVDDESLIRMDMRSILESIGEEVVGEGRNGIEAIELTKSLRPDVVLMDIKMPELDGIEAARQIGFKQLAPVVLLTAYSQEDLVKRAGESGVYGYLIKPVRENQILPTLQMAISRFHDEKKLLTDISNLEAKLEERKLVAKATGIMVTLYDISEDEAYKRLRKFSMDKGYSLSKTCKAVIKNYEK